MEKKIISGIITFSGSAVGLAIYFIQSNKPLYALITFLVTVLVIIFFIWKFYFDKKKKVINIKNHPVFLDFQELQMNIRTVEINNENLSKDACGRDMIILIFSNIDKILLQRISNMNNDKICEGGCGFIQKLIHETIEKSVVNAREIKIPEIYITTFMGFLQSYFNIYLKMTTLTCQSQLSNMCHSKMISHLFNTNYLLHLILNAAESSLGELNGNLDEELERVDYFEIRKLHIEKYGLVRYE